MRTPPGPPLSLAFATVRDFVSDPHTAIVGEPQGEILNLVDARAKQAQTALLTIAHEPITSTSMKLESSSCRRITTFAPKMST